MPSISLTSFNGGYVDRRAPHQLALNESQQLYDVLISDGSITPLNGASVSTSTITTGTASLYKFNGNWETATTDRWFAEDNGYLYWADGGTPQKVHYFGSPATRTVANLGIVAPGSFSATYNSGTGSGLFLEPTTGVAYVLTNYSSTWVQESAPSPIAYVKGSGRRHQDGTSGRVITAAIGAPDTSITINNADGVLPPAPGTIRIDSEDITYTGVTGGASPTLTGVTRGANGTTAAAHAIGTPVYQYYSSISITGLLTSSDGQVANRNLYRLVSGAWYQLAQLDNVATTYTDTYANNDPILLAKTVMTVDATYAPPPALTGICGPYNGMMFGWIGNTLYWGKQGFYGAWPAANSYTFKMPIACAVLYGGVVLVLTQDGPWIISGTSETTLSRYRAQSTHGCSNGRTVAVSEMGAFWLSPVGIVLFNGFRSELVSASKLTNFTVQRYSGGKAAFHAGFYYLFTQSNGTLIGDFRSGEPIWTMSNINGLSAYAPNSEDAIYFGSDGSTIMTWNTGVPLTSAQYQTGNLSPDDMDLPVIFHTLRVNCRGTVTVTLWINDTNIISRTIGASGDTANRIRLPGPKRGSYAKVVVTGTGTVYAIDLEYSPLRGRT